MNPTVINDLQDHFDGRSRLRKASTAIKCYTQKASLFFSYIDGWGKKQYVNIPIEPSDLLPILDNYITKIDEDIMKQISKSDLLKVTIDNLSALTSYIEGYKNSFPSTFTSLDDIVSRLERSYKDRLDDDRYSGEEDYHIEVCSDWQDKIYVFSCEGRDDESLYFKFKGIVKL